jgi:prevent-host-death family protein
MKYASVAETKSRLTALLVEVETGDSVVITRRGKPVARIVPEPQASDFGWAELHDWVAAPAPATLTVAQMREQDLL